MRLLAATVTTDVAVDRIFAFKYVVPVDLTSIFTGYGPLPAVIGTKGQTGAWDGAGQTRTVLLSDGSSVCETLTEYKPPAYFSYTVGFTGVLRFLAASATGQWWFSSSPSGKTHIKWRYAFQEKSLAVTPVLWFVAQVLWRGYMGKAMGLIRWQLEQNDDRQPKQQADNTAESASRYR